MENIDNIAIANKLQNSDAYKTFQEALRIRKNLLNIEMKRINEIIFRAKNKGRLATKLNFNYDENDIKEPGMCLWDKNQIKKYFEEKGYIVNYTINEEKTNIEIIISWNFIKEND